MRKIMILTIISFAVIFNNSCQESTQQKEFVVDNVEGNVEEGDESQSDQSVQSSNSSEVPFELNVLEHKFMKMSDGAIAYNFIAEVTNKTNKSIISVKVEKETGEIKEPLIGEQYAVAEKPYLSVVFENQTIKLGEAFMSFNYKRVSNVSSAYIGGFNSEIINDENPWEPNAVRPLKLGFGNPYDINDENSVLKNIHFNYIPNKCLLVIPITAKDPIGYKYSGYLVVYDILEDCKSFQQELNKK